MSAEWRFLVTLNGRLRPLRDPVRIQEVAVQLVCEHLEASRVNYTQVNGNELVIRRSYARNTSSSDTEGPVARMAGMVVDACRRGETVVVEDTGADSRITDAERTPFLAGSIGAFTSIPLTKGGRWLATLDVHSATPRNWTADQIAVAEIAAERIWGAGERARAEGALDASAGGAWSWSAATNQVIWSERFRVLLWPGVR